MSRNDICDFLIHFTKGVDLADACETLSKIVHEGTLQGNGRSIRGGYPCICFSEAPLASIQNGLINPDCYSKYSPFGIMIKKEWLFQHGGRPVIYEPDIEFQALPDSHKWRHVRYEPPMIDFSWEREWRIKCDSLQFDMESASIVAPNQFWANHLIQLHDDDQECEVIQYGQILGDTLAQLCCDPFKWNIITLESASCGSSS